MELTKHLLVTRVLTDDPVSALYYDQGHIVGELYNAAWDEELYPFYFSWGCGSNRTVQAGDVVFFLTPVCEGKIIAEGDEDVEYGFFAHGSVIAAPPEEQLRLSDSKRYGDLSAAYCSNEDLDQPADRFQVYCLLDAMVVYPLPIRWLQRQPDFQHFLPEVPISGDLIPAQFIASLNEYWEAHVDTMVAQSGPSPMDFDFPTFGIRLTEQIRQTPLHG